MGRYYRSAAGRVEDFQLIIWNELVVQALLTMTLRNVIHVMPQWQRFKPFHSDDRQQMSNARSAPIQFREQDSCEWVRAPSGSNNLPWISGDVETKLSSHFLLLLLLCSALIEGTQRYISVMTYPTWCSWRRWWFLWCEALPGWCSLTLRRRSERFSGSSECRALRCSGRTGLLPLSPAPSGLCAGKGITINDAHNC